MFDRVLEDEVWRYWSLGKKIKPEVELNEDDQLWLLWCSFSRWYTYEQISLLLSYVFSLLFFFKVKTYFMLKQISIPLA